MIEAVISVGVLGILLGVMGLTQGQLRTFNALQLAKQRCAAAGQAQIDSIAATGNRLDGATLERLWPSVATAIEQTPGRGDWAGLTRVKVTSRATVDGRPVVVSLTRYVSARNQQ